MELSEVLESAKTEFVSKSGKGRRYAIGMLIAFIDLINEAKGDAKFPSFQQFLKKYPRLETSGGSPLSTLTIRVRGQNLGIRRYYNRIEAFFRAQNHRWDFPKAPGHGTSKWQHFMPWLDELVGRTPAELSTLRSQAVQFVLDTLPSQKFDPSKAPPREPLLFSHILAEFQFTMKGEREGAALQGAVFGFLRADNPHLQVEPRGSRTGSRRQKGVGDIDCWDANRLVISAEVKQTVYDSNNLDELVAFGDEIAQRRALGFVVALDFKDQEARDTIGSLGLRPVSTSDLHRLVEFWDPLKQRAAVNSFVYYCAHIERSTPLFNRLEEFVRAAAAPKADYAQDRENTNHVASE